MLAAAVIAALRARGVAVRASKPVISGLDEPPDPDWPPDHELLARVAGCPAAEIVVSTYGPPVSPHLAAALAGRPLQLDALRAAVLGAISPTEVAVIEGVGGLLVPLNEGCSVRDLARAIGLPLLIAARPGLGTINHTLLTLEAARSGGLAVAGVVLTPWPEHPDAIERSNRQTISALGGVEVQTLPRVARADPMLLAQAASSLPLERWLG